MEKEVTAENLHLGELLDALRKEKALLDLLRKS